MEATKTALRPEDFEIIQNRKSQGDQLVREPVTLRQHYGLLRRHCG